MARGSPGRKNRAVGGRILQKLASFPPPGDESRCLLLETRSSTVKQRRLSVWLYAGLCEGAETASKDPLCQTHVNKDTTRGQTRGHSPFPGHDRVEH